MQRGSPERNVWRWYRSLYPLTQIVLACMVVLVLFLSCSLCLGVAPTFVQGIERGFQNSTAPAPTTPSVP